MPARDLPADIDREADYLIGLKGSQGRLRGDVELFLDAHLERGTGDDCIRQDETIAGDHGRIETRRHTVRTKTGWLGDRRHWPSLKSAIMTGCIREISDEAETVRSFYIASLDDSPENISQYIRDYWQVENSLHRVLDVTFRQGACRIGSAPCRREFRHPQTCGNEPVAQGAR